MLIGRDRLQFFDPLQIQDGGAAHPHERSAGKLLLQTTHRIPENMGGVADMQDHVISGSLHPVHVFGENEDDALAGAYGQPAEARRCAGTRSFCQEIEQRLAETTG